VYAFFRHEKMVCAVRMIRIPIMKTILYYFTKNLQYIVYLYDYMEIIICDSFNHYEYYLFKLTDILGIRGNAMIINLFHKNIINITSYLA